MKLRNKKTGCIVEAYEIDLIDNYVYLKIFRAGDYDTKQYNSLAEFNEEWEDMPEEPKGIKSVGTIGSSVHIEFKTEEEAIKAKEHLLAWQRLKDKGFKFTGLRKIYQGIGDNPIGYTESPTYISFNKSTEDFVSPTGNWVKENWDDLQLIFGGEE